MVRAAGETVTLDPATTIGTEWWRKAGIYYVHRNQVPPSPGFSEARRTTVADADGNFTFENLPAGKYYVRTKVTWEIGGYFPTQGGLVGKMVEVKDNEPTRVILNEMTD
ncbi:hypothetical protein HMPREF9371_0654 [Neisseria shayeganii 871]|uniref:Carboxypeptidase regulatory-like domain-containing protein n=1 Tax=Neisseria shayeganii 871 TaxID=1032488 RepID=G4CGB5_9NEIS|nr:hypothetical protein HMPREF9371_0654 [Neisseria shayeganii 871]